MSDKFDTLVFAVTFLLFILLLLLFNHLAAG